MKVGNTINGLTVTDVKRVNKLNLIQFLKEVDNYLKQGYRIDVNSARQVGLVLQADMFKTEAAFGGGVEPTSFGSVGDKVTTESENVASKEAEPVSEDTSVPEPQSAQSTNLEDTVEPAVDTAKEEAAVAEQTPVVEEQSPLTPKKTTTRSKKIDQ